jgi:hypothetical protein
MPQVVELPDQQTAEFPDDMPPEKIAEVVRKQFPPTQPVSSTWNPRSEEIKVGPPIRLGDRLFGPMEGAIAGDKSAPEWARNAALGLLDTARGVVPGTVEDAVSMLTPVVGATHEIAQTVRAVHDWFSGKPVDAINKERFPESQILSEAEKTPALSRERFAAGTNIVAQMLMAVALTSGMKPKLAEQLAPVFKEAAVPEPITPATDAALERIKTDAAKPVSETGALPTERGIAPEPETKIEAQKGDTRQTSPQGQEVIPSTPTGEQPAAASEPASSSAAGTLPVLTSTEEAIAHGQSGQADPAGLRAEHERLIEQSKSETGDQKVETITQAQLYREAAETAEKSTVTLYHSTPNKFEAFTGTGTPTGLGGKAFYFSDKPEPAYGENVIPIQIPKSKIANLEELENDPFYKNAPNVDERLQKAGYEGTFNPQTGEYTIYDPNKFVAKPKLLPGEKQGDLISSTQTEDFSLVGEKGIDYEGRQSATEAAKQALEEARLKAEHEQGLLADFAEHQATGGDELLDAVKSGGGLPELTSEHAAGLSGELQNVHGEFLEKSKHATQASARSLAGDIKYSDVFKKGAGPVDQLTQHLKAKGFDVETPGDMSDLIKDRIRSGKPIYGSEARGAALGIVPQPSEFVKQDVAKALSGVIKGARQIKAIFTPANMSEASGVTARIIRENAAQLARDKEMAATSLKEAAQIMRRNDKATNLDIIDRLETGKPMGSPGLDAYKQARQAGYDERIKQVQAVNPNALQDLIENYFPHLWTRESVERLQGNLANIPADNPWARVFGKRPLAGPASFLKQRSIPTTAEGIAIGLEPVTTNPVALDLLKMHEMDRYVMGKKIIEEMKDRGLAKFVPAGETPEVGHTQINDKIARILGPKEWQIVNEAGEQMPGQKLLGHYYAPDDAAKVINNYLSPGLRGFAPYDAFRFVGNLMNQVQLGISLYHATFTSIDAATSTLSLGLEQLARSGGSPKELAAATGNIARAFVEAPIGGAMIENLWRGNKFLREYSKPGTTNAELAKIVDAAVAGGARVRMDTFYNTGAISSFFDALKSGNYAGAVLRAPFAVVQAAAKPLMEYAVPRTKLGIISQNLEYELRKLPANATRDDVRKISARVVDSVDNRMGQLIYDNLFWNKALKDGLMGSIRSVGWNLGDIRELGGGVLDTVTAPKRAYDALTKGSKIADNPVVTKRMAYAVALPLMVGVLGSMYQYLMTGEGPKDLMDVYMPRTGRMKPDGTPERVMLPTYMKDIAPLALAGAREGAVGLVKRGYSMALNKLHPLITTIGQMLHNQDYYGNQIRNEGDDTVTTIKKEADFVIKNFRPFSVQGVIQREGGVKEKAQAVVGLMPAPRELTDTPAMRMIHNINLAKRPAGGYTSEQQQKREDKRRAQQSEDLRPELFKRLSNEDKARVMEVATPEEREIFQSYKTKTKATRGFSIKRRDRSE